MRFLLEENVRRTLEEREVGYRRGRDAGVAEGETRGTEGTVIVLAAVSERLGSLAALLEEPTGGKDKRTRKELRETAVSGLSSLQGECAVLAVKLAEGAS